MYQIEDTATQANITYLLRLAQLTLTDIELKYNLYRGACGHAIKRPEAAGEKAIITALRVKLGKENLNIHPYALWPRRYGDNGKRLSQSIIRANYRKVKSKSLCKKVEAA